MAKRRRIDLKFVVITALVLVGLAGAAYVARKTVFRPNPDKFIAAAKDDMQKGDWDQAIKDMSKAIRYARGPDPTSWLMLADAFSHKTGEDFPEYNKQWLGAVNQALTIDPNNKAALSKLAEYELTMIREVGRRGAGEFDALTKYNDRILAVDPSDKR